MIKPISAEVYLKYRCSKCSCEWTKTPKEVIKLRGMVCGSCNHYDKFEPITRVDVIPVYDDKTHNRDNETSDVKTQVSKLNDVQINSINAMVNLGYKRADVTSVVKSVDLKTEEEYILHFLKGVK